MHVHSDLAYRRRKKRLRLLLIFLTAVVIIAVAAAAIFLPRPAGEDHDDKHITASVDDAPDDTGSYLSGEEDPVSLQESSSGSSEAISEAVSELSSEEASEPSSSSEISSEPSSETSSGPSYVTISGPSAEPSSESSSEGSESSEIASDPHAVPESGAVSDSYFDSAVFVGNSRTQGFVLYSGLTNVTAYTDRGLNVDSASTKEVVSLNGDKVTVLEALRRNDTCRSVYMMFGINELGWPREEIFIEKYTALIDAVQENNPDVQIYLESILPVSKQKSDSDKYINNARIREFNELIRQMAVDKGVHYLDLYSVMADEAGDLPADAASDGIHLKKAYCVKWLDYLRTHVVPTYHEEETSDEA